MYSTCPLFFLPLLSLLTGLFFPREEQQRGGGMAAHALLDFNEDLFSVMLETCTSSRMAVEAVTYIALRYLTRATDVWSALRKALVRQQELESEENKALWCVMDSLMKHAPHVFVPLIAPRLFDYVVQQMPWHLAGVVSTMGGGALWCDTMIRSWEGVLPPYLFQKLKTFVVQLRSGRELTNAMSLNIDGDEVQIVDPPATQAQLQQLRETWEVFRSFLMDSAQPAKELAAVSNASLPAQVKRETCVVTQVKMEGGVPPGCTEDGDDSDVEYLPDFVKGAQHRELPSLSNDVSATQRARRAARRRPRDED